MNLINYWDSKHILFNNTGDIKMLTGTSSKQLLKDMCLFPYIKSGVKILMVGVGTGRDTQELAQKGCIVDAFDISEVALDRIKPFVRKIYSPNEYEYIPMVEYDLIISHFVAQHMTDADLVAQIYFLMPCLKDSGIFALQFVTIEALQDQSIEAQQGGGCSRTFGELVYLLFDFEVELVNKREHSNITYSNYVHIRKRKKI